MPLGSWRLRGSVGPGHAARRQDDAKPNVRLPVRGDPPGPTRDHRPANLTSRCPGRTCEAGRMWRDRRPYPGSADTMDTSDVSPRTYTVSPSTYTLIAASTGSNCGSSHNPTTPSRVSSARRQREPGSCRLAKNRVARRRPRRGGGWPTRMRPGRSWGGHRDKHLKSIRRRRCPRDTTARQVGSRVRAPRPAGSAWPRAGARSVPGCRRGRRGRWVGRACGQDQPGDQYRCYWSNGSHLSAPRDSMVAIAEASATAALGLHRSNR